MISIGWPSAARALQEPALAARAAQCVRAHHSDAVGMHRAQPLPESLQTAQRPVDRGIIEPAALVQSRGEPDHLAQPIQDDELAVRVARHDHVKAVGTEIDCREHVRHGATAGHLADRRDYAENEDPQPQVVLAFGLRMTNWAPCRSSL